MERKRWGERDWKKPKVGRAGIQGRKGEEWECVGIGLNAGMYSFRHGVASSDDKAHNVESW